ncbi:MAG TPA: hypothetical protein VD858_09120 [Reyranella sp.]|nr:hypothetical protein [Reyranella sp.]
MATMARFYDGETAQVHDVSVRTTTNELVIFRLPTPASWRAGRSASSRCWATSSTR